MGFVGEEVGGGCGEETRVRASCWIVVFGVVVAAVAEVRFRREL